MRRLIKKGKMTEAGLKAVSLFFNPEKEEKFVFSEDIIKEIRKNTKAWKNFNLMDEPYKRIRLAYIESQRKHSKTAFEKSLANFIKKTEQNKKFGMLQ